MAIPIQTRDSAPIRIRRSTPFARTVAFVAIAAALVSLTGSWIPSLWGDEAASIMSATRTLPSLITMLGTVDAVHGSYYLFLHFWIELFGSSPFSVRLPSAVAVGATVVAVMLIVRRLDSTRVAVAAGVICAVIPRVTYMGAETRSSAFASAIVAWLTLVLIEIVKRRTPSRRWWFVYGALLALGTYVFLYVALVAVAHAIVLLSIRADRRFLARWAGTVGCALVAAAPVFIWAVLERKQVSFLGRRDVITLPKIMVGVWFGQPLFAVVAWTLIACAVVATLAAWRSRGPRGRKQFRMPRLDVVAASWFLVPALILIGGFAFVPVYSARYLSYCAPAAAILMALGLDWAARGRTRLMTTAVLLVVLCAVPVWVAQRQPNAKNNSDFADTSAIIAAHATAGDGIVFDESVRPSRRPRLALHLYPRAFAGLDDVTLDVPFFAGTSWHDTALDVRDAARLGRFNGVSRVWLIEHAGPSGADNADRLSLDDLGYTRVAQFVTHRSVVYEYVLPGASR